jgi:sugar phosphate isomerase/epimerase
MMRARNQENTSMKLGVITALFENIPFETMLDHVAEICLQAFELGMGAFPSDQLFSAMGWA